MKVIAICGSLTFKDEMMKIAVQMELLENVIFIPIFSESNHKVTFTEKEQNILGKMHKEKIKLSDAIFVVNVNSYIGKSTKSEIEFAKSLNKEVIYDTDLIGV